MVRRRCLLKLLHLPARLFLPLFLHRAHLPSRPRGPYRFHRCLIPDRRYPQRRHHCRFRLLEGILSPHHTLPLLLPRFRELLPHPPHRLSEVVYAQGALLQSIWEARQPRQVLPLALRRSLLLLLHSHHPAENRMDLRMSALICVWR
ncbi:MAG: hypothetical protein KatS3mg106_838 [Gemmataceae bacterium]|nr:MAG: hypothetical protein KatS3mg106_838 [Gemmataceae bacterium]